MGPRKKLKPNSTEDTAQPKQQNNDTAERARIPDSAAGPVNAPESAATVSTDKKDAESRGSTQNPGIDSDRASVKSWKPNKWSAKAAPVAQLARESITAATGATSDLVGAGAKRLASSSPSRYLSGSVRRPRPVPLAASTTKVNVTSTTSLDKMSPLDSLDGASASSLDHKAPAGPSHVGNAETESKEPGEGSDLDKSQQSSSKQQSVLGWYGWWSRPDNETVAEKSKADSTVPSRIRSPAETPLPATPPNESTTETPASAPSADGAAAEVTGSAEKGAVSKSWFWSWSKVENARGSPPSTSEPPQQAPPADSNDQSKPEDPKSQDQPPNEGKHPEPAGTNKASGWAFWSQDKAGKEAAPEAGSPHKQVGELAVADTPSQSNPEAAQFNEQQEPLKKDLESKVETVRTKGKGTSSTAQKPPKPAPVESAARKALEADAAKQTQTRRNVVLPAFRDTYPIANPPSYLEQVKKWWYGSEKEPCHLAIAPKPPRIKKALAIGIHGFFPSPLVQKVIGQPTGTSIRFANNAAVAVKEWVERHGSSCVIEKVALEGEGTIADRVDTLWKLLLNWIDHIKSSDFIFVACHSQGVPVAIMLLAKLLQFGCISNARIGVCAMAGINLGPFAEYKSRIFGVTAFELFDFSTPDSRVSRLYLKALEEVLQYGARILYTGSIDDQLVSLEVRAAQCEHVWGY